MRFTFILKEVNMQTTWINIHNLYDFGTKEGAVAVLLFIMLIAWLVCVITTRLLRRPNWVVGTLKRRVDQTVVQYIVRGKNLLIWIIAAIIYAALVPGLRAVMGSMMAGAGITALVVGFAAKSTLANLISGLSIAVYRPIRIGDKVDIEGEYSTIEDITLRHTIVTTWTQKRLIIPNSKLDEMIITNYSIVDPSLLCVVPLGVSYDTDIDLARRIVLDTVNECPYRDHTKEEDPYVRVISHGDFSIGLRVYVWVADAAANWSARFWLFEHIKKAFDREGIEIPFPYRTMVYKKDLPPPRRSSEMEVPPQ
jgi:small-conductance mechanosensitive channel